MESKLDLYSIFRSQLDFGAKLDFEVETTFCDGNSILMTKLDLDPILSSKLDFGVVTRFSGRNSLLRYKDGFVFKTFDSILGSNLDFGSKNHLSLKLDF